MEDFLNDTLDLVQGVNEVDCECSAFYFYGTCDHVHRTILLVDDTDNEDSADFFADSERCVVLDGVKIYSDRTIKKLPLQLVLEYVRSTLVYAMQNGKVVIVRMQDTAADFLSLDDDHCPDLDPLYESYPPYGKLTYTPFNWLLRGGQLVKQDSKWPQSMFRRDDLDRGRVTPVCHPYFGVMFTTTMPMNELDVRLFDGVTGLPKGQFDILSLTEMMNENILINEQMEQEENENGYDDEGGDHMQLQSLSLRS
jgi:hypothetical protein